MLPEILDLPGLRALYGAGSLTPSGLCEALAARMEASDDPAIFITRLGKAALVAQANALITRAPQPNSLPLWGIPFAVKDNIDVSGVPTTAACPAFAYTPDADAFVVAKLRAAGAIVIGKTNLDQFATGLNGTRSPYGAPRCVFDKAYISGGSSSGSAVAVAAGLAAFSLGTDTAGSGRVPAAFNNLVGIKPTPGLLSTSGAVPACRSLDVISIFATSVSDGVAIRKIAEGFDAGDPFSRRDTPRRLPGRPRVGILQPGERIFHGDDASAALYQAAIERLADLGAIAVPFDYAPFREIATLLYGGPWVAERLAAVEDFYADHADAFDPTVGAIIASAKSHSAVDAFKGRYRLEALRRRTETTWAEVDLLLLPTAPTIYKVAAMQADPVSLNSNLGYYTNFANLLGLAAIAIPAGFRSDGLPFGITLIGLGSTDDALAPLAEALHRAAKTGLARDRDATVPPATLPGVSTEMPDETIPIVVVGAHLSGMPLNNQLTTLGGTLMRAAKTKADYKLYALPGTVPAKPGLVRDPGFAGPGIAVEVWALSPTAFARFVSIIPAPLGIGRVMLADGTTPQGFLCEQHAVVDARDVTSFGGWRAYVAAG